MDTVISSAQKTALKIAKKYVQALRKRGVSFQSVILFGSQARGTAKPESDLDLLVIVENLNKVLRDAIINEAYDLSLEEDMDIIAIPCDTEEFNSPIFQADFFYKNVKNDGVVIT
ncbi:MAG: nucleotidyltransferase domain-containing protein [Peptococcaceae bacterium]|nr:nucleotidyltransferase domain-containing protein [Peptococcaceae bacterium]